MAATRIDFLSDAVVDGTQLDLSMHVGDDYAVTVFFKDSAGDPIDITSWVFKSIVQDNNGTDIVELDVTIEDAAGGEIKMAKARAVTETLTGHVAENNKYDLFATDAANERRKWFYGLFQISGSISEG